MQSFLQRRPLLRKRRKFDGFNAIQPDQVVAEGRLDGRRELPDVQGPQSCFKIGIENALAHGTEIASELGGAGILGIGFRQFRKGCADGDARTDVLQQRNGLRLGALIAGAQQDV